MKDSPVWKGRVRRRSCGRRIAWIFLALLGAVVTSRIKRMREGGYGGAGSLAAKLDTSVVESILNMSKETRKVLAAVETGTSNHLLVPTKLISKISGVKGGAIKHHISEDYDGYRLTYRGLDALAILTLISRGVLTSIGPCIGRGKESDVYLGYGREQNQMVVIKKSNWLLVSKIAASKEFRNIRALYGCDFPVPQPIDHNRHIVVMEYKAEKLLNNVASLRRPQRTFGIIMEIVRKFLAHGLIHGDLNEFNLLIEPRSGNVTVIDFPQMISKQHSEHRPTKFGRWLLALDAKDACIRRADELWVLSCSSPKRCQSVAIMRLAASLKWLSRDVDCVVKFFKKRFGKEYNATIDLEQSEVDTGEDPAAAKAQRLDRQLRVSGCYGDDHQSAAYERHRKELLNSNIADDNEEAFQLQDVDLDALWDDFAKREKREGRE